MSPHDRCAVDFARRHPEDAALQLERLPAAETAAFLRNVEPELAVDVIAAMQVSSTAEVLACMSPSEAASMAERLPMDRVTRVVRAMPNENARLLIEATKADFASRLDRVLQYPAHTVGSIMAPSVFSLSQDQSVAEGLRTLRRTPASVYYYLYTLDREGRLKGVLDVRELLEADPSVPLRDIAHPEPLRLSPMTDISAAAQHTAWRNLDALPVVDANNHLIGILRYRTLRQQEREAGRDIKLEELGITLARLGEMYWSSMGVMVAAASSFLGSTSKSEATG